MGDDMGGFKHGGPLMGYRDGGWPPQRGALRSLGALGGLPALLIAELLGMSVFPKKLGDPNEAKYFEELDERAFRDKMDEKHGIGWSTTIGKNPRINPGRRIDLSRVMRAGR